MTLPLPAEDMTELVDADIPRVDLVGKAANGTRFLMRKAADGGLLQPLVPADMVAELIAKADAQEGTDVTDPAPTIVKADGDSPVAADDLIPEAPGGSTANSLPGSPDWETLDGETAMGAVATLGRVKSALAWLSDREAQEAVTGDDPRDGDNAWNLDDLACQLDWIIGQLAGFAVGEQLEAELAPELEAVGKAVAAVAGPLAVVEGLAPIAKAGRVLSSANEAAIRTAVDSLTGVLNSLPQAPAAEEPVTKTEETDAVTAAPEMVRPDTPMLDGLLKSARALSAFDVVSALADGGRTVDVTKAKGDPQMAVFSADGKLVGVIDPADLNPIAATEAPTEGDTEAADDAAPADGTAPADAPADPAPAAPAADDSRVVPGTDTVQAPVQPDDTQTPAVAKTADPATLEELRKQVTEDVRKGVEAELTELREQVRKFGLQPDNRRSPVLNGATGTPGAATRDTTGDKPLTDVLKAIDGEPDPIKRDEMRKAAFFDHFKDVEARFQQG